MPTLPPDTGDTDDTTGPNPDGSVALHESADVDILFVLDNSGSMAEEQALLADSIAALTDALVGLNWRVGMTTTDAGNPRCANTTPEDGDLVLSSCVDRVGAGDFTFADLDFAAACTDRCALTDAELVVTPTTTQQDVNPAPRKWVESTGGTLNIEGVSGPVEALQCYLPQGVSGCGFESHLQSMFRALAKAGDPGAANNFGFVRESGVLALVMVSDETDCSFAGAQSEIFTVNKVFWEDPDAPAPTSAVCWNAGVACSGTAPTWTECHAENWDADGDAGASDADAVLQPVSAFIEFVQQIEDQKKSFDPLAEVVVGLISGVPIGYDTFDAELVFEDSPDPDFQGSFGIGPGCIVGTPNDPSLTAVPPVREREWAEAFEIDGRNLYSICDGDYASALADIGQAIRAQIRPLCFPQCAADVDPVTVPVDANCQVYEENLVQQTKVPLAKCEPVGDEWIVPAGEAACFAVRIDNGGQTPGPIDDMSQVCVDEGFNVEFVVVRAAPKPAGTTLSATCELSPDKATDCPNL
jgi:hypothetical protein